MTVARPGPVARRLAGIVLAAALAFVAEGATFAVLGPYVHDRIGAGDGATGLVLGVGTLASLLARGLVGARVDVHGPRRLMAGGMVLVSLAGPLYLAAGSVAALVAPRLVQGAGQALIFTAGLAWAVAISPAARRGQVIGLFGLSVWAGLAVGPVIAAGLRAVAGYDAVWALVALAPLPGLIVLRLLGPSPRTREPGRPGRLIPRAALVPGAGLALGTVGQAAVMGFTVLTLDHRGIEGSALALAAYAVTAALVRIVAGRLPDRAPYGCLAAASTAGAAGLLLVGVAGSLAVATAGTALMGVAWALLFPSLALLVVRRLDPAERGAGLAAWSACFDIGFSGASPLLGLLAAALGYGALFVAAAVCVALVAPVARLGGRARATA